MHFIPASLLAQHFCNVLFLLVNVFLHIDTLNKHRYWNPPSSPVISEKSGKVKWRCWHHLSLLPALCLTGWVCWLQSWEPLYSAASPLRTASNHRGKHENSTCSDIPLIYNFFFCSTRDRKFVDHPCDNILKQPSTEQSVVFQLSVPGRRCWGQTDWTVWRKPLQSGWSSSAHPRMSSGRNHSPDKTHIHKSDEAHLHDWAFYMTHTTQTP